MHQSLHQSSDRTAASPSYGPRSLTASPRGPGSRRSPTARDVDQDAFQQDQFEALGLELRAKHGTIAPAEQERLGVLQAKIQAFWAQRSATTPPNLSAQLLSEESRSLVSSAMPLQAKFRIGEVGDRYEQEADRVAQQVVQRMHSPSMRSPQTSLGIPQAGGPLGITRLQRQALPYTGELDSPATLESTLQQGRGGGQPLPELLREEMEQAFGADFRGVRLHTDMRADQLNRSLQSRAFTSGPDLFFRRGEYDPDHREGQALIAHELTHVIQQGQGGKQHSSVSSTAHPIAQVNSQVNANVIQRKLGNTDIKETVMLLLAASKMGGPQLNYDWSDPELALSDDLLNHNYNVLAQALSSKGFKVTDEHVKQLADKIKSETKRSLSWKKPEAVNMKAEIEEEATVYTHVDDHQIKHTKFSHLNKKQMIQNHKDYSASHPKAAAVFYQEIAQDIENQLKRVILKAHELGTSFVDMGKPIGIDEGVETSCVELYYNGSIGSHMRPKRSDRIKAEITQL